MSDYNTKCPVCSGAIKLTGFTASCEIPVQPDGWCYADGPMDSTDEVFHCRDCHELVPTDYVFKSITKAAARKAMGIPKR